VAVRIGALTRVIELLARIERTTLEEKHPRIAIRCKESPSRPTTPRPLFCKQQTPVAATRMDCNHRTRTISNFQEGFRMKKMITMVFAGCMTVATLGAFAADNMAKDGMMKKDEMKKDVIVKDGMMKKDEMKKDGMAKEGMMKKEEQKK